LKDHPLQNGLIFLALSIVLAKFGVPAAIILWKFAKIPPQRLNVWIIKARLSASESKLRRLDWLRSDMKRLILHCFLALTVLCSSTSLIVISLDEMVIFEIRHAAHQSTTGRIDPQIIGTFGFAAANLSFVGFWFLASEIIQAVKNPDAKFVKLSSKIERLKEKLQLKSANVHWVEPTLSNTLTAFRIAAARTWVYLSIIFGLIQPAIDAMVWSAVPVAAILDTELW
jgi:hypothetical protein